MTAVPEANAVFGRYKLLELLACGGMAEVYKAKSTGIEGFEKLVVIKRILPVFSEDPAFVDLFINEAKIACSLSHRNVVQVFDLGVTEGTHFIAMEYVDGPDLRTVLKEVRQRDERMPREMAVYVVTEVAKALDFAHRRRDARGPLEIVHQDVSPQNILLSRDGEVKLTDFGIAVAAGRHEGARPRGKFNYMAPEQVLGGKIDRRTDVFSLAVVLYESLAGANPFENAETPAQAAELVRRGAIPPLASRVEVPEALSRAVAKAMSFERRDRPSTAIELHDELIEFTYIEQAGMRAGGHDLSAFVEATLEKEERTSPGAEEASRMFRAALETEQFEDDEPESTDVEPTVIEYSRSFVVSSKERDVTAIAIQSADQRPLPASLIEDAVRRSGGAVVESRPESMTAILGGQHADGRDREVAANVALQIARILRGASRNVSSGARIGLDVSAIAVNALGEPLASPACDALIDAANAVADRARDDRILVSRAVHDSIRGRFRLKPMGEAFALTGERSMHEGSGRFVGRRGTLRRLAEALGRAEVGDGPVLVIVGEEGSGKTRLLGEVARRLARGTHEIGFYIASCTRRMRDLPLAATQEMLRAVLGIDDLDDAMELQIKLGRVRELGLSEVEHSTLAAFLGVPHPGTPSGELAVGTLLAHVARKLAEDRPTVFAWDGAENLDEESLRAMQSFISTTRGTRLAVVFTCRSGYERVLRDLPSFEALPLEPLEQDEITALMASRLGARELPEALVKNVVTKSRGNPLFAEAYLTALVDAGAVKVDDTTKVITYESSGSDIAVPGSLRAIVAARVAQLPSMQRDLLRTVAAARTATAELLGAVFGESPSAMGVTLTNLERAGLIVRQGAAEYVFAHDLLQKVALETLGEIELKDVHARLAHAYAKVYPDRLEELAYHFREAGDRKRAVDHWVQYAEEHAARHASEGVVHGLTRAIEVLREDEKADLDRLLGLYVRLGDAHLSRRDPRLAEDTLRKAIELAAKHGAKAGAARCAAMLARVLASSARFEEAEEQLVRARRQLRGGVERTLRRDVARATAHVKLARGDFDNALRSLTDVLGAVREDEEPELRLECHAASAIALAARGRYAESAAAIESTKRAAEAIGTVGATIEATRAEALAAIERGDYAVAAQTANKGLELALERDLVHAAIVQSRVLAESTLRTGDFRASFRAAKHCFELATEHGFTAERMWSLGILGFIDAVKLGSEEGRRNIQRAIDYAEQHGLATMRMEALYFLAMVDARRGENAQARDSLQRLVTFGSRFDAHRFVNDAQGAIEALASGAPMALPSAVA